MGSSLVWPRATNACQRRYHARVVGASEYGTTRGMPDSLRRGEGGETSEAYFMYVCSEVRTVIHRAVLT